jgi:ribose-phosphate pyrophosphokinase
MGVGIAVINKSRTAPGERSMSEVIGDIAGKHCILLDDIVDTANTLCLGAELLKRKGAAAITACITHAVLSGDAAARIAAAPIERLYLSNSIPHSHLPPQCLQLPIYGLIANALSVYKGKVKGDATTAAMGVC